MQGLGESTVEAALAEPHPQADGRVSAAVSLAANPADRFVVLLATGFGCGYSPLAPGTVGSLFGLALVAGLSLLALPPVAYATLTLCVCLAGPILCGRAAAVIGVKDPGEVVYDEIAAFFLVFAFVPVTAATAAAGFALFRLLDVTKPWPLDRLERLPGGWGIMADDLAAGLATGLLLGAAVAVG